MTAVETPRHRRRIYAWKRDRPAAFHGTGEEAHNSALGSQLREVLHECFPGQRLALWPAGGQGNHITSRATNGDAGCFVRLEDGPERDDSMEVEARGLRPPVGSFIRPLLQPGARIASAANGDL